MSDTRRNDVREALEEIMGAVNARKLAESRAAACTHLPRPRLRDVVIGEPSPMRAVCISCVAELVEQLRATTQMLIERLAAPGRGFLMTRRPTRHENK